MTKNYHSNNKYINKILETDKITQQEYDVLFIDKSEWFEKKNNIEQKSLKNDKKTTTIFFQRTLQKLIDIYHTDNIQEYDLAYIYFIRFNFHSYNFDTKKSFNFSSTKFADNAIFHDIEFNQSIRFSTCTFESEANFIRTKFKKKSNFWYAEFKGKANFWYAEFDDWADFRLAWFQDEVSLKTTKFKELHFMDLTFSKLNLESIIFENATFLNLHGSQKSQKGTHKLIELNKNNFSNKESARILRDYFESKRDITESNTYFPIEQELYIEELKSSVLIPHRNKTLAVLYLSKYISYFGMDYIRPLLVMFIFGFFSTFIYNLPFILPEKILLFETTQNNVLLYSFGGMLLSSAIYWYYHTKDKFIYILLGVYLFFLIILPEFRSINNDMVKLVNPLNIFKSTDYFEHIAPYGLFVKAIVATLIYQFIVAFRQNTRRK